MVFFSLPFFNPHEEKKNMLVHQKQTNKQTKTKTKNNGGDEILKS